MRGRELFFFEVGAERGVNREGVVQGGGGYSKKYGILRNADDQKGKVCLEKA